MKIVGNEVFFSTGRVKYANDGIIGLGPDGAVSEGYDGGFWSPLEAEWKEPEDCLTPAGGGRRFGTRHLLLPLR